LDDLEFRRKAIIDPENQCKEFLQKAHERNENRHFVEDQIDFQHTLTKTLWVDVPKNLTDRIILSQQLAEHKKNRQHQNLYRYMTGIAAALVIALGVTFFLPTDFLATESDPQQLTRQIINHLYEDTHALNVSMDVPKNSIDTMLASYGGKLSAPIGNVTFLGHCIVGKHTGIHLVLNTSQGLVTVIILPSDTIQAENQITDPQFKGIIYPSHKGSIAIIGETSEPIAETRKKIDHSLTWLI
jgi:hypothetical protein